MSQVLTFVTESQGKLTPCKSSMTAIPAHISMNKQRKIIMSSYISTSVRIEHYLEEVKTVILQYLSSYINALAIWLYLPSSGDCT